MEDRIEMLEFQMELLFNNSALDRYLYETKITRKEYRALMGIMNLFRDKLDNGEEVYSSDYEQRIYEAVPKMNMNYHFCELFAKMLAEEGRWEEVFPALYGDSPKYKDYFKK